ncbi:hypothetical protein MUS_3717 [Bacillus sp. CN2]|uniref:Uncharacterized protein n=1 Tax=Bacillus amyloliquefaciens (strain Y2) TaxID=1155777 RepID=I2CAA7_BACAY|nr:hypothetical protein MUS_3717 [Bacillus velezensis YAU B9601-Y2]ANF38141.1 hypothetical protein BCBMB205_32530 [Bacillus velezensis]ARZ59600.1 hypothetical protein BAGQ_3395 [Bacillus velezensis]KYC90004.1 hypothetical protein B4140_2989 [Bacillus amyloliquefaciens]GFR54674.1 hypothetical protein MUS_3717 [Bacillus sp. CN2]
MAALRTIHSKTPFTSNIGILFNIYIIKENRADVTEFSKDIQITFSMN